MKLRVQNPVCITGKICPGEFYEQFFYRYSEVINSVGQKEHIYICINSSGGDTHTTLGIYDVIASCPNPTVGLVAGRAESGASLILQACRRRLVTSRSSLLIHSSTVSIAATTENARAAIDRYAEMDMYFHHIYAHRMKTTVEEVAKMTLRDMNFDAQQAIAIGLADEIV